MTDTTNLFNTGVSPHDLERCVAKLRELKVSHAVIGPVELWLDPEYKVPQLNEALLDAIRDTPGEPGEFTEAEEEYIP